jgi:hypothetical protein
MSNHAQTTDTDGDFTATKVEKRELACALRVLPLRAKKIQDGSNYGIIELWDDGRVSSCITARFNTNGTTTLTLYDGDNEDAEEIGEKLYEIKLDDFPLSIVDRVDTIMTPIRKIVDEITR